MTTEFNFMPQNHMIASLLTTCVGLLDKLPAEQKEELTKSLMPFEDFGATVMWSAKDVSDSVAEEFGLTTEADRESVICRFLERANCTEADWEAIYQCARDAAEGREVLVDVLTRMRG